MKQKRISEFLIILLSICVFILNSCRSDKTQTYDSIKHAVDKIWLIDTHEHFPTEAGRQKSDINFFSLIIAYMYSDMVSSGMSSEDLAIMLDNDSSLEERWNVFYPYWEKSKNTGYGQCVRISVKGLFGIDEINENTYKSINEKMLEANETTAWYK